MEMSAMAEHLQHHSTGLEAPDLQHQVHSLEVHGPGVRKPHLTALSAQLLQLPKHHYQELCPGSVCSQKGERGKSKLAYARERIHHHIHARMHARTSPPIPGFQSL